MKLIAILLSLGALSAPAMAATESIKLDFKGLQLNGLSEVQLKEELRAQHPEINADEVAVVGLEVTGRIDGQDVEAVRVPMDEVSNPWILATDGHVRLDEVKIELAKSGGGQIIIRRGGYYDRPDYDRPRYRSPYDPRNGNRDPRDLRDNWNNGPRGDERGPRPVDPNRDYRPNPGGNGLERPPREGGGNGIERPPGRPGPENRCAPGFPCRGPSGEELDSTQVIPQSSATATL